MFRWNLMLRTRFGSHGQPSEVRCRKTVKPRLEILEDRTVPSIVAIASPPPVPSMAAVVSYLDMAMDQWMNLLATAQQDLSNAYQFLGQQIAQEVSSVQQQWDSILGISSPAPTPAPNTASQQRSNNSMSQGAAGGSGSGSGATPDQPISSGNGGKTPQPVTSGSGSGIATPLASGLPGTVKGEVWLDNNGDGSIDNHELGYVGATVNLYYNDAGTWDMFATTTTTSDNPTLNYSMQITVPYPNSEFELQVVFPWSFEATIPGASQINAQGYTSPFYLSAGGTVQKTAGLRSMNVNTTADDPNGPTQPNTVTLRDAIETGNNGPPNPAVTFYTAPNTPLTGTISLQAALPAIQKSYNITGPGSSQLAVQGPGGSTSSSSYGSARIGRGGGIYNASGALDLTVQGQEQANPLVAAPPFRIYTIKSGVTSCIGYQTIEGGRQTAGNGGNGGGVYNSGILSLYYDTITNNQASSTQAGLGNGGAIYNAAGADLTLENSSVRKNSASGYGGGIDNLGTLTIASSRIVLNKATYGGGIANQNSGATCKLQNNVAVMSNTASTSINGGTSYGGGIYISGGTVSLTGASGFVSANKAPSGGGIYVNSGKLTWTVNFPIDNNTATTGNGGGIYIKNGNVTGSVSAAIKNNSATDGNGGGIYNSAGALTLTGLAIAPQRIGGNSAIDGGGMYLGTFSTTTFNRVVVQGNQLIFITGKGEGIAYENGANLNPQPLGAPNLIDADDPNGDPVQV